VYLKKFSGDLAPGPPGEGNGRGRGGEGDTGGEGRDWARPMFDTDRRPCVLLSGSQFCHRFVNFDEFFDEVRPPRVGERRPFVVPSSVLMTTNRFSLNSNFFDIVTVPKILSQMTLLRPLPLIIHHRLTNRKPVASVVWPMRSLQKPADLRPGSICDEPKACPRSASLVWEPAARSAPKVYGPS
jgi:hypothetical protein